MPRRTDDFLHALDDLEAALAANERRTEQMRTRMREIRQALESGRSLTEVVPAEKPPLIVQLVTESSNALHETGNLVRTTEARLLHRDGMTMDRIAALFGVTRQRVSALLKDRE